MCGLGRTAVPLGGGFVAGGGIEVDLVGTGVSGLGLTGSPGGGDGTLVGGGLAGGGGTQGSNQEKGCSDTIGLLLAGGKFQRTKQALTPLASDLTFVMKPRV